MTTAILTGSAIALSSGPVPTMLAAVTDTMRVALDQLKTAVVAGRAVAMIGIVAVSIRKPYDLKLNPRLRA
jgi:ribosomal protein L2